MLLKEEKKEEKREKRIYLTSSHPLLTEFRKKGRFKIIKQRAHHIGLSDFILVGLWQQAKLGVDQLLMYKLSLLPAEQLMGVNRLCQPSGKNKAKILSPLGTISQVYVRSP